MTHYGPVELAWILSEEGFVNSRLIRGIAFMAVQAFITSAPCVARVSRPAELKGGADTEHYASYISMIKSAIQDEMVVATSVKAAQRYGVESSGQVALDLDVLIAPFAPSAKGFSTQVIYLVPGYGYVIRQVTVYSKEKLALFWLGYSVRGPGTDTGFNCTHSRSNCKIEDIPFGYLRSAFCSWWSVPMKVEVGNSTVMRGAKQRNAERTKIIEQGLNAASR